MATWPTSLPLPLANTLKETPPESSIRTQMDKGPAKVRRRTTAAVRPLSFEMVCDTTQIQTLDDFYVTDTAGGSDEFIYTHPRTNAAVSARFTAPPQYSDINVGSHYNVSIQLEILP